MTPTLLLPKPRVTGHFKLVATKLDGSQRVVAEFENLITDEGLNRMGIGAFRSECFVGTGSSAPLVTDAQLQTTRARTTNSAPATPGTTSSPTAPYFTQTNAGFRFGVGAASGNLTEVGMGWSTGALLNDYVLWCRALIKDGLGNPIAVTILADEVLDVYYAMRLYPPVADATYSINISGDTYDCITRAANVTNPTHWPMPSNRVQFQPLPGGPSNGVFNGTLGPVTGSPNGVSSFMYYTGISNAAYSNNSRQQDGTYTWGLNDGNISGGIRSVLYQTGVGCYQTQFTPAIPKDATKVLSVNFRVSWARHT